MSEAALSTVRTKRWTRLEYERLIDLGAFGPEDRLELLGGQLVVREPQGRPHATGIRLVAGALRAAFGPGWTIEAQLPVALDEDSEPEPDIAVLPGGPRDYAASHPTHPTLVVEVALASLALDRGEKASLYARAGVTDYWIVNLVDNLVEVHRTPVADRDAPYGWRYRSIAMLRPGDAVTPLALPSITIPVVDLLP
ncbi:MAG TPA: Uma2 family endonuclease [Candidatus Deferrimicrobiaceae bacterium]|nr:Uma2 family endonuclease [Candidatus Deferrimicrobiaceae bacterium]